MPPANGTILLIDPATGEFTYTPGVDFTGTDTFTYQITDPSGNTDTATVTINVLEDLDPATNDSPDAQDDVVSAQKNETTSGNALVNDSDLNGDALTIIEVAGTTIFPNTPTEIDTENGTLEISDDGFFTWTPDDDFVGLSLIHI